MAGVIEIGEAIEILGRDMVVTSHQARQALGEGTSGSSIDLLPFPANVLERCAEQNRGITADWRLMFDPGIPLTSMRVFFGSKHRNDGRPHFYRNRWWLKPVHAVWVGAARLPAYHLLNFNPQHFDPDWTCQVPNDPNLIRANEVVVTAACLANYFTHNGERLLGEWYHWGETAIRNGSHVSVGQFDRYGFHIWFDEDTDPTIYVGMVEELVPDQ